MVQVDTQAPAGRRETQRLNRREAILDVAQRSFLELGYAATTMSSIAATLGGSKGTLWNYFASKELLFAAVVERATSTFQAQVAQILVPGDDIGESLGRFATRFLERVNAADAIALRRLVMGEAARFPETGRIFHERASGRTRQVLAAYIAGAMARGQLRNDDPAVASRLFMALCLSGSHEQLLLALIPASTPAHRAMDAAQAVQAFLRLYAPEA